LAEKKRQSAVDEKGLVPGAPVAAKEILSLSGSMSLSRILALENRKSLFGIWLMWTSTG